MLNNREMKKAKRLIEKKTGIYPNTVSFPAGISFKDRSWRERLFTRPWRPWIHTVAVGGIVGSYKIQSGVIAPGGLPPLLPQYICSKHGVITAVIAFAHTNEAGQERIFCVDCVADFLGKHLEQVYLWKDELTKHDFEISPPNSKN